MSSSSYSIDPANPLPGQFQVFAAQIGDLISGLANSVAAFGAPGIGKSRTVEATLKAAGLRKRQAAADDLRPTLRYYERCDITSVTALEEKLYEYRTNPGSVLVFDDTGDAFMTSNDHLKIGLFKTILENKQQRVITAHPRKSSPSPSGMPVQFTLGHLGICWISNLEPGYANHVPIGQRANAGAIMTRLQKTVFSSDASHILDYTLWLAHTTDILHNVRAGSQVLNPSLIACNEALEFFTEKAAWWITPCARTLETVLINRHVHPTNWKAMVQGEFLAQPRATMVVPAFVPKEVTRRHNPPGQSSDTARKAYINRAKQRVYGRLSAP